MEYIVIEVPDMNDSVSRIVLNGTQYQSALPGTMSVATGISAFRMR